MNSPWRLFLAALRFVTQGTPAPPGIGDTATSHQMSRFVPVVGALVGLLGAGAYWGAAQIWPTSVAVVLSLLATVLLTTPGDVPHARAGAIYWVFLLLTKYNALMALSAANMPFAIPPFFALGSIMVAAHAASRTLVVSVMATETTGPLRVTAGDLCIALLVGSAPAALLGIPGLIALVSAIVVRLCLTAYVLPKFQFPVHERLDIIQQLTEVGFYLGALASWKYI